MTKTRPHFWFNRRQLLKAIIKGGITFESNGTNVGWRYGTSRIDKEITNE